MNSDKPSSEQTDSKEQTTDVHSELPGFGASNDGREKYEWESKYPSAAKCIIKIEAAVLILYFFLAFFGLFFVWCGWIERLFESCCHISNIATFRVFGYITFSGYLAGTIFAIKWLYHVVGKGEWHEDRQLWRFMSPLISMAVAFMIGAFIHANLIKTPSGSLSPPSAIALGFMAGYFSDSAIAKMYEIATVLFGPAKKSSQ